MKRCFEQQYDPKTMSIVRLNGSNDGTWKVQCSMAFMKDGVWSTVNGTEATLAQGEGSARAKYMVRRDKDNHCTCC